MAIYIYKFSFLEHYLGFIQINIKEAIIEYFISLTLDRRRILKYATLELPTLQRNRGKKIP